MTSLRIIAGGAILLLAACQGIVVDAPMRARLSDEVLRRTPPQEAPGVCWASDISPAIIETETVQEQVAPEVRDAEGRIVTAAIFRSTTRQRMVQDREQVWFRAPCPEEMTVEFIATLQRALKARGLYLRPLTGVMDAPTEAAIRQFQAERGLDSPTLSLAAAQELGIINTALDAL